MVCARLRARLIPAGVAGTPRDPSLTLALPNPSSNPTPEPHQVLARAPGPLGSTLSALRDATISLELDHAFTVAGELANPNPNPSPNPNPDPNPYRNRNPNPNPNPNTDPHQATVPTAGASRRPPARRSRLGSRRRAATLIPLHPCCAPSAPPLRPSAAL